MLWSEVPLAHEGGVVPGGLQVLGQGYVFEGQAVVHRCREQDRVIGREALLIGGVVGDV